MQLQDFTSDTYSTQNIDFLHKISNAILQLTFCDLFPNIAIRGN